MGALRIASQAYTRARADPLTAGALAAATLISAAALGLAACGGSKSSGTCVQGSSCLDAGQYHPPPPPDAAAPKVTCQPADLGGFQPVSIQPVVRQACTDAQIHAIASACYGSSGGVAACNAALSDIANESCVQDNCLFSVYSPVPVTRGQNPIPAAQGPWGPVVQIFDAVPAKVPEGGVHGLEGLQFLDLGTCLLIADPKNTVCAQRQSALFQCEMAACAGNCPLPRYPDSPELQAAEIKAFDKCTQAADTLPNACKTFADSNAACVNDAGGTAGACCYDKSEAFRERALRQQCGVPADAGVCLPADVWDFKPVPVTPAVQHVCTPSQIHDLVMACYDPSATNATCQAWTGNPSNGVCYNSPCLDSNYSNTMVTPGMNPVPTPQPSWGAFATLFDTTNGYDTFDDLPGCIMLADPSQAKCGQAFAAFLQCAVAACGANCPLPNPSESNAAFAATGTEVQNCFTAAWKSVCQAYSLASERCLAALPSSSPAQFCLDGSLFSSNAAIYDAANEKLINLQCGEPDAGARDAGVD
jgi:hypothetical protein